MMRSMWWMAGLALMACSGDPDAKDTSDSDSDSDTDTTETEDTVEDTDTDTDTEVPVVREAVFGIRIEATVSGKTFSGIEERFVTADEGDGDDLCRIRYDLVKSAAPAVDCDLCDWAFDMQTANPTVVTDVDGACETLLFGNSDVTGISALSDVDGAARSYGYGNATGHAQQLLVPADPPDPKDPWKPLFSVLFEKGTGAVTFNWQQGFVEY